MKNPHSIKITREKHLDHLVRVVPVLVICYAVQCFFILNMGPNIITTLGLSVVGGILAAMIMGFIGYDLKHQVDLNQTELKIDFFFFSQIISYDDILALEIRNPGQSFSTLVLKTSKGETVFYFIDDAEMVKKYIENQKQTQLAAAA